MNHLSSEHPNMESSNADSYEIMATIVSHKFDVSLLACSVDAYCLEIKERGEKKKVKYGRYKNYRFGMQAKDED